MRQGGNDGKGTLLQCMCEDQAWGSNEAQGHSRVRARDVRETGYPFPTTPNFNQACSTHREDDAPTLEVSQVSLE